MSDPADTTPKAADGTRAATGVDDKPTTQAQGVQLLPLLITYFKQAGMILLVWVFGYFGFSCAWVLIVLAFYIANQEYRKLKDAQRAFAREAAVNEKAAILARVDELPSWVFFPDVERAEWLNKMIKQMWPYIGVYVKTLLKQTVEPQVQNSMPKSLLPFKFEQINLGDIPPRIGGVKVYVDNVKRDEVILDMEIFYASDSEIKVSVRGMNAGIKQLTIHGIVRVVMRPLVSVVPIIGGLNLFFLNVPSVDFDLTDVANILDMPLLSNSLRTVIENQIAHYLVLPNKIPIALVSNMDLTELKYPLPQGIIRLHVVAGRELKRADVNLFGKGKSDPYCKLYVGAQTFKTKVIQDSINPVWNQYFEAVVDQKHGQFVEIECMDEDPGEDDELGTCSIDIEQVSSGNSMDTWLPLENVKTGMVHIRALWLHLSKDPEDLSREEQSRFGRMSYDASVGQHGFSRRAELPCEDLPSWHLAVPNGPSSDSNASSGPSKSSPSPSHSKRSPFLGRFEKKAAKLSPGTEKKGSKLSPFLGRSPKDGKSSPVPARTEKKVTIQDVYSKGYEESLQSGSESHLSSALLMVNIDSAKSLPRSKKSMTEPSPYVKLGIGNEVQTSGVKPKTADPKWEENFQFLIHNPRIQELYLEVLDSGKSDRKIGNASIPLKNILAAKDLTIDRPFTLRQSGQQSQIILRLCLRILSSEIPATWAQDQAATPEASAASEVDPNGTPEGTTEEGDPSAEESEGKANVPADPASEGSGISSGSGVDKPTMIRTAPDVNDNKFVVGGDSDTASIGSTTMVTAPLQELRHRGPSKTDFGRVQLTIRYSGQRGRLVLVIHQCQNLIPCDDDELADPYVRIYLLPDKSRSSKNKTQTVKNNLNPTFDETFEWSVTHQEAHGRSLDIMVKNSVGVFSRGRAHMGQLRLELSRLDDLFKPTTQWFDLQDPEASN